MISPDKSKIIWETAENPKNLSFSYWDKETNTHIVRSCTAAEARENQYIEAFAKTMYPQLVTGNESPRVEYLMNHEYSVYDTLEDMDIPKVAYNFVIPESAFYDVIDYFEPRMMEESSSTTWEEVISEIGSEVEALQEKIKNLVKNGVYKANEWNIADGCRYSESTDMTFPEVYKQYVLEAQHCMPPDIPKLILFLEDIDGDEPTFVKYLITYCHNQQRFLCRTYADELSKYYGDIKTMMWNIFTSRAIYDTSLERKNEVSTPREITLTSPKDDGVADPIKETDVASSPIQDVFDEITKIITKDTDKRLEEYIAQKNQSNDKTADLEKDTDHLSQDLQDAIDKGLSTDYAKKLMKSIAQIKFSDEPKEPDFEYEEGVYSREIFRIYNGDAEHPKLIKQVYGIPKKDMWNE